MDPATDRSDHVAVLRLLIEKRDVIFELPSVELNDVYLYLQEHFPDVLDALLRRRYTDTRHHTSELPDLSLEVAKEASSASGLEGDDQLGSPLGKQGKKYVRRRYTDRPALGQFRKFYDSEEAMRIKPKRIEPCR